MKKLMYVPGIFLLIITVFSSCKKEMQGPKMVTETVDITIKKNASYTYVLPANESDDEFQITSQAMHYSQSQLENSTSGNDINYNYAPVYNFVGTDKVVIANVEEEKHHGHGKCNGGGFGGKHHDQETEKTIIINITVTDNNSK